MERISVRLTPEMIAVLSLHAHTKGLNLGQYIRRQLVDHLDAMKPARRPNRETITA